MQDKEKYKQSIKDERWELLNEINSATDKPIFFLAFIWLGIIIIDFTRGLNPLLIWLNYIIWVIFILDFLIELIIAPDKTKFIKSNWITGLSVVLPAFGILRLLRITKLAMLSRFIRSINLLRLLTSIRRGTKATKSFLSRHGFGYIVILTILIIFAGAAGMYYFENPESVNPAGHPKSRGLTSYWDALWWTAMIMTTMGSQYWPVTVEGRILCWLLALYAFSFFGYITATIASYFIKPEK